MSFRARKAVRVALLGMLAVAAGALAPARAQLDAEGIFGIIVDQDDNPLAKVEVVLRPFDNKGVRPQKVQTSKKGRFIFPLVRSFEQKGWILELSLEGYRPYKFSTKVNVAVSPISEVTSPLVGVTVMPGSLSLLITDTSSGSMPL